MAKIHPRHRWHCPLPNAWPSSNSENLESRVEPRAAWAVAASCATPHVPIRCAPGEVLQLVVAYHADRKRLPVVKLAVAREGWAALSSARGSSVRSC
jgi:hypothetical protein